jgi:outer membrane protein OmpA-like peptidoglycan-associated protein
MKSIPKLILTLITLFFLIKPTTAQIWLSNEDIYDEAEEFLDAEEYVEALPLYLLLEKKELLNANISYKIGSCYLNIRGKKDKSIPYLELAAKNISSDAGDEFTETRAPLKALLLLGVAYRIDNRPKLAISIFEMVRDSVVQKDPEFASLVDMHIQFCKNAILLDAFPGEPRKEKLPPEINDEFSNYNPILSDHDSVLYYMEELKFYDALMRSTNTDGKWSTPVNLTPSIGSDGDHILVGASADGQTLFLYNYEGLRAGELYTTQHTDKGWSKIEKMNGNINTAYNETHASLSNDGKTLYFTSNRPGGQGGLDIYKSVPDGLGQWGPAVNLGPVVNTPFNEETPFMNSDDEILYFSSQGHLSMGGYDIFYALKTGDNKWHMPINMGAPISTTDDDLFYFPLEENVRGLMSRLEQPTSTGYDIYLYNSMVFSNSPRFKVKGKVEDADSENFDEYSVAVVNKATTDTLVNSPVNSDGTYDLILPSGDFEVIVNNAEGTSGKSQLSLNDASPESQDLAILNTPDKATEIIPSTEDDGALIIKIDSVKMETILFSFDNSIIPEAYLDYLNEISSYMGQYDKLMLKIEGYADALGSESYNLKLSEKRAQTVAQYLINSKVDASRLKVSGMGENSPVALNTKPDGSDNPEGRKYNRRVIILPVSQVEGIVFIPANDVPLHLKVSE